MFTENANAPAIALDAASAANARNTGSDPFIEAALSRKTRCPRHRARHLVVGFVRLARRLPHRGSISDAAVFCIRAAVGARGDDVGVEVRVGPLRIPRDDLAAG